MSPRVRLLARSLSHNIDHDDDFAMARAAAETPDLFVFPPPYKPDQRIIDLFRMTHAEKVHPSLQCSQIRRFGILKELDLLLCVCDRVDSVICSLEHQE
jgi:hypothetical protein